MFVFNFLGPLEIVRVIEHNREVHFGYNNGVLTLYGRVSVLSHHSKELPFSREINSDRYNTHARKYSKV